MNPILYYAERLSESACEDLGIDAHSSKERAIEAFKMLHPNDTKVLNTLSRLCASTVLVFNRQHQFVGSFPMDETMQFAPEHIVEAIDKTNGKYHDWDYAEINGVRFPAAMF